MKKHVPTELEMLQEEFSDFSRKEKKLEVFLQSDEFKKEEVVYRNLLIDQKRVMQLYLEILAKRINILQYRATYR